MDRAERAPQRGAQPEGDLPRPDVDGRLHGVAHDHDAVLPVRLRRPVRRRDRGDRVAASIGRKDLPQPAAARRGGRRRASTAARRGTSSTTCRTMPNRDAGAQLWARTDLKPSDVQMAQLYDGFSWLTMSWLEALGLCGVGESGPFIEGGERIARDGELPLNTHGGQLSAGRLHGYGFLHEGATQMWGEARRPPDRDAARGRRHRRRRRQHLRLPAARPRVAARRPGAARRPRHDSPSKSKRSGALARRSAIKVGVARRPVRADSVPTATSSAASRRSVVGAHRTVVRSRVAGQLGLFTRVGRACARTSAGDQLRRLVASRDRGTASHRRSSGSPRSLDPGTEDVLAACLDGGTECVASHRTAAALHGFDGVRARTSSKCSSRCTCGTVART